jgi:hypothetical protein
MGGTIKAEGKRKKEEVGGGKVISSLTTASPLIDQSPAR